MKKIGRIQGGVHYLFCHDSLIILNNWLTRNMITTATSKRMKSIRCGEIKKVSSCESFSKPNGSHAHPFIS